MSSRSVGLALFAAVALGCSGDKTKYTPTPVAKVEPVALTPGEESKLLPLKVGNQWTYVAEVVRIVEGQRQPVKSGEITFRVAKLESKNGGQLAWMEIVENGQVTGRQLWQTTAKGIYQVSYNATTFKPAQPMIEFPVEKGREFQWKGTGVLASGGAGESLVTNRILGPQEVDTEMGRMSAIAVHSRTRIKVDNRDGIGETIVWFTPGVGIVRFKQELTAGSNASASLMKLKSYSPKS